MYKQTLIKPLLVTGLAIGAASFPTAAQARFMEDSLGASPSATQSTHVASTPARPARRADPSATAQAGFQWGDAGIGAAGALMLIGVGSGAAVAARRRNGALA